MDKKTLDGGRIRQRRRAGRVAALLLACAASSVASADSLFLAGAETSDDGDYVFLAAMAPFRGSTLGNGFVQRYWIEWLRYTYVGGNDRVIEAKSPGLEAAVGYQGSHANGYYGAYAGLYYRDVDLRPDDPAAEVRGKQTRLRLQVEGEQRFAESWRVNAIASYVLGQDAYWVRGRLLRSVKGPLLAGLEAVVHGDPDYKGRQFGVVLTGMQIAPGTSVGVKLGSTKIEGRDSEPYIGIEFGRAFGG